MDETYDAIIVFYLIYEQAWLTNKNGHLWTKTVHDISLVTILYRH